MARSHRLACIALATVAVLSTTAHVASADPYNVVSLENKRARALGDNGYFATNTGVWRYGAWWPASFSPLRGCGINGAGHVVTIRDYNHAALWVGGVMHTMLGAPDGCLDATNPGEGRRCINNSDQVVGEAWTGTACFYGGACINAPGILTPTAPAIQLPADPDCGERLFGSASLINDAGHIVCIFTNCWCNSQFQGYWGLVAGGVTSHLNFYPLDLNNSDVVVGGRDFHAVVWQHSSMDFLPDAGAAQSSANSVNDAGDIVGWTEDFDGKRTAVRWTSGGGPVDLNTLIGPANFRLVEAVMIDNSGEIWAKARPNDGNPDYDVLLTQRQAFVVTTTELGTGTTSTLRCEGGLLAGDQVEATVEWFSDSQKKWVARTAPVATMGQGENSHEWVFTDLEACATLFGYVRINLDGMWSERLYQQTVAPDMAFFSYDSDDATATLSCTAWPEDAASWTWDFGDGSAPAQGLHVVHAYPSVKTCQKQTFRVKLTTMDVRGNCSIYTEDVPVRLLPAPGSRGVAYVIIGDVRSPPGDKAAVDVAATAARKRLAASGYEVRSLGYTNDPTTDDELHTALRDQNLKALWIVAHGLVEEDIKTHGHGIEMRTGGGLPTWVYWQDILADRNVSGTTLDELTLVSCYTGFGFTPEIWGANAQSTSIFAPIGAMGFPDGVTLEKGRACSALENRPAEAGQLRGSRRTDATPPDGSYVPMLAATFAGETGDEYFGTIGGGAVQLVADGAGDAPFAIAAAGLAGTLHGLTPADTFDLWANRYARFPGDTLPPRVTVVAGFALGGSPDTGTVDLTFDYDSTVVSNPGTLAVWSFDDDSRAFTLLTTSLDEPHHQVHTTASRRSRYLLGTSDGTTSVSCSRLRAIAASGRVEIEWATTNVQSARVSRATPGSAWTVVRELQSNGTGLLHLQDADVTSGARYGYRLSTTDGSREQLLDEVWLDVPGRADLALRVAGGAPSAGKLQLEVTLPDYGPARIELMDVSGRRVWSEEVGHLGAGVHRVSPSADLAAGVYQACLTTSARRVGTRVIIMR